MAPYLPSAVTFLRLIALPLLILTITDRLFFLADVLFIIAIASDLFDGYLARRLGVASRLGTAFDVSTDFWFIGGMFLYFGWTGVYPIWVFILMVLMFAQFALTSLFIRIIYDPFGKYLGGLLYGAIGLTILFSGQQLIRNFTLVCTVLIATISLLYRTLYIIRKRA